MRYCVQTLLGDAERLTAAAEKAKDINTAIRVPWTAD
jgi:hypothetical protein